MAYGLSDPWEEQVESLKKNMQDRLKIIANELERLEGERTNILSFLERLG